MNKTYDPLTEHVYETACRALDREGIRYERYKDKDMIYVLTSGRFREYSLALSVNERQHTLLVCLNMPLDLPKDRLTELCLLLAHFNLFLPCGSFACLPEREPLRIDLRLLESYEQAMFSEETVSHLVLYAVQAADRFFSCLSRFRDGESPLSTLLSEDI